MLSALYSHIAPLAVGAGIYWMIVKHCMDEGEHTAVFVEKTDHRVPMWKECARPNCEMRFTGRAAYCSDDCKRLARLQRERDLITSDIPF
jgi:hypothetical protein